MMNFDPDIPDFDEAADAPLDLLLAATLSARDRALIAQEPDLRWEIRNSDPSEWGKHVQRYRASQRSEIPVVVTEDASGMRRQAAHDLHEATTAYGALSDGRRNELFRQVCLLAKYVVNGVLTADELRAAFLSAAELNGALARHGARWFEDTIGRGLELGRNDKLPPLARRFRSGRGK